MASSEAKRMMMLPRNWMPVLSHQVAVKFGIIVLPLVSILRRMCPEKASTIPKALMVDTPWTDSPNQL